MPDEAFPVVAFSYFGVCTISFLVFVLFFCLPDEFGIGELHEPSHSTLCNTSAGTPGLETY